MGTAYSSPIAPSVFFLIFFSFFSFFSNISHYIAPNEVDHGNFRSCERSHEVGRRFSGGKRATRSDAIASRRATVYQRRGSRHSRREEIEYSNGEDPHTADGSLRQ